MTTDTTEETPEERTRRFREAMARGDASTAHAIVDAAAAVVKSTNQVPAISAKGPDIR